MNNIKTADDVRAWAKMIVDAKGDMYTPLAKADMLVIAQFIMDAVTPKDYAEEDKTHVQPVEPEQEKPQEEDVPTVPSPSQTEVGTACPDTKSGVSTVTMMRGYALHRAGFTVQQAYDKFLEWSKGHPKEASVMDFSTGVRSANAAFAYWLAETTSVEFPTATDTI
ncbi:MAG: hypothetical protein ACI4CE_07375 [Methanomethylophilus alvi]